jgi:hypothetical protein
MINHGFKRAYALSGGFKQYSIVFLKEKISLK